MRIRLGGLIGAGGHRVRDPRLGRRARRRAPGARGAAISELTDGNAFLVCELWRALVETGVIETVDGSLRVTRPLAELGTPESVREVVSQRLAAPVSEDDRVAGAGGDRRHRVRARARAPGERSRPRRSSSPRSTRPCAAGSSRSCPGTVSRTGSPTSSSRRAVYDRLTAVRRAELHLRVGEAREAADGRSRATLADLAYHFTAAAPLGETARAIEYNRLAARAATEAFAFGEAASCLRRALELGIDDRRERAELLLELGNAENRAGRSIDAIRAFEAAVEIARELGDARLLARAAIGYEDAHWRPGVIGDAAGLLEEAAVALGDERSELRVGLLSGSRALARHAGRPGARRLRFARPRSRSRAS